MADVKISALPAAGTLAGSDVLPMVQPTGTKKVALSVLDGRWLSSASGGTVNGGLTVNPYIAVGTNPAQVGVLRLPNNQWITVRNAANTADLGVVGLTSANQFDVGTTGYQYNINGTRVHIVSALSLGTNPASTGIVRLPNNQAIVARNAANTADQVLVRLSSADQVIVGDGSASSTAVSSSANTLFNVGGVQQMNLIANAMQFKDNYFIFAGSTVGLRIGTAATEKLGFFGATPVVRPTGTPAAATDPATTMALVNSLRASLIALGLIS